jgi:hypothetical protein
MIYSEAEREAIGLCICLEAVSDIANHALLELRDVSMYPGKQRSISIHIHQHLFLIRRLICEGKWRHATNWRYGLLLGSSQECLRYKVL